MEMQALESEGKGRDNGWVGKGNGMVSCLFVVVSLHNDLHLHI
jgi:hypothetical protein